VGGAGNGLSNFPIPRSGGDPSIAVQASMGLQRQGEPMGESKPMASAGVHFPPPLLYVAGVAAGWGLHRWHSLPITADASWVRTGLGAAGILAWLGLFLGAAIAFRRAQTSLIPNRPATAIVTRGPYRFTRNPMYVSLVALYAGVTLLMNTWWPFVILPLVVVAVDRAVIAREERYLASAFPAEYGPYAARVRRWI
jgi:protein-S-isoprenylcysteine O-methyltransferase Ste14